VTWNLFEKSPPGRARVRSPNEVREFRDLEQTYTSFGPNTLVSFKVWTEEVSYQLACESRASFRVGDDQKVVNFRQILFANERILDSTEAPDQSDRAFNLTF
jgi:hypothetical protein